MISQCPTKQCKVVAAKRPHQQLEQPAIIAAAAAAAAAGAAMSLLLLLLLLQEFFRCDYFIDVGALGLLHKLRCAVERSLAGVDFGGSMTQQVRCDMLL